MNVAISETVNTEISLIAISEVPDQAKPFKGGF